MKLLILGASGGVGKKLVKLATERGHVVSVLIRPSSQVEFSKEVIVFRGEYVDSTSVAKAVQGQDAVLSGLGHVVPNIFPWSEPTPYLAEAFQVVLGEMKKSGVNKFSHISAAGVGHSWIHVPFMYRVFFTVTVLRNVEKELLKAEEVVKASELDYQLNRPLLLTNEPLSGRKARIVTEAPFIDRISRADVAEFMLDEVEKPNFTERVPMIMSGI
jgi:putative NADH-flavin reductase